MLVTHCVLLSALTYAHLPHTLITRTIHITSLITYTHKGIHPAHRAYLPAAHDLERELVNNREQEKIERQANQARRRVDKIEIEKEKEKEKEKERWLHQQTQQIQIQKMEQLQLEQNHHNQSSQLPQSQSFLPLINSNNWNNPNNLNSENKPLHVRGNISAVLSGTGDVMRDEVNPTGLIQAQNRPNSNNNSSSMRPQPPQIQFDQTAAMYPVCADLVEGVLNYVNGDSDSDVNIPPGPSTLTRTSSVSAGGNKGAGATTTPTVELPTRPVMLSVRTRDMSYFVCLELRLYNDPCDNYSCRISY